MDRSDTSTIRSEGLSRSEKPVNSPHPGRLTDTSDIARVTDEPPKTDTPETAGTTDAAQTRPEGVVVLEPTPSSAAVPDDGPASQQEGGGPSQSVGHPRDGRLVAGVQLKPAAGIRILRPERAWASEDTVYDLLDAIDRVRRKFPDTHTLLIGDLSKRAGGPLPPHQSHQSGRDVDVGLFFKDAPKGGLDHFAKFDARPLDALRTWTLVAALIGPDVKRPRVKHIFLDWEVQEILRREGAKAGLPRSTLDLIFQFPKGGGIVRHVEGHEGHLHVRFPCARADKRCTDYNPESVAQQKVRRKCVKRRSAKAKSKLQQLLQDDGKAKGRPDVHCFIVEYE